MRKRCRAINCSKKATKRYQIEDFGIGVCSKHFSANLKIEDIKSNKPPEGVTTKYKKEYFAGQISPFTFGGSKAAVVLADKLSFQHKSIIRSASYFVHNFNIITNGIKSAYILDLIHNDFILNIKKNSSLNFVQSWLLNVINMTYMKRVKNVNI